VGAQLGNTNVTPSATGPFAGKFGYVTHHPYNFVFLDGCNTGLGDFPEAFGIPKFASGSQINNNSGLHKRAFMGWSGPVTFQVDPSHIDWSLQFWTVWLNTSYTSLTSAINTANNRDPSVKNNVPIKWYGNGSLIWND
jgi:hypothetical protein